MRKLLSVEYVRVSTDKQDETMQRVAALLYLKDVPHDEVETIIDHGVSASKTPMAKRIGLQKLLRLIEEGRVKRLIVYERDRLARDLFEYAEILKILYAYDVEVIFTASGARPFVKNFVIEAIYMMTAQAEAQSIQRRATDTSKRYPAQLLGYNRQRNADGFVVYGEREGIAEQIRYLFAECSVLETGEQFMHLFVRYKRLLKRPEWKIAKILKNPFYCGHAEKDGHYQKLIHVDPLVSLETFLQVQQKIDSFADIAPEDDSNIRDLALAVPVCGLCMQEMQVKVDYPQEPRFVCARRHAKLEMSIKELNSLVRQQMNDWISALDVDLLSQTSEVFIRKQIQKEQARKAQILKQSLDISNILVRQFAPSDIASPRMDSLFEQRTTFQQDLHCTDERLYELNAALREVALLVDLIRDQLNSRIQKTRNFAALLRLVLDKIVLHPDYVEFHLFYSDFVKGDGVRVVS